MPQVERKPDLIWIARNLDQRLKNVERTSKYDDESDAPPLPPSVNLALRVKEVKKRLEFRAVVTWGLVSPNTCQADVERWIVQIRATNAGGTPIDSETINAANYDIKQEKRVDNKGDTDVHAVFPDLPKPKKWYWQARVAIRDKAHRLGPFSAWTSPQLPVQAALPKPPTPTGVDLIFDTVEKTRFDRIRAIVQWNEITNWDVPGGDIEDDMSRYQARIRHTSSDGTPFGAYNEKKTVEAKDGDADVTQHTVFRKGIKKQHYYQASVRSIDRWNRRGDWSAWTTAEQATVDGNAPASPTNVTAFIDQHRIVVEWDSPRDAADSSVWQEDILNFQVQVATDAGYTTLIRDIITHGEHKTFKVKKPQTTYWVRVRSQDASWNKSNWINTSASKVTPNAPTVALSFDAGGSKKSRYRVVGTVTPGAVDNDDDVAFYRVQFVHKGTNVAPTVSEPRAHQDTDPDDDLKVIFRNIRKSHYTFMRVRAVDHQGRKSNYSAWTAGGLPSASGSVSAPSGVVVEKGPRRIHVDWNAMADTEDEVDGYKIEVRASGVLRKTKYVGGKTDHYRYMIPAADRGLSHEARVFARDDLGNESTSGNASATDDVKLDDTDLLSNFNQGAGKTYTFEGIIRLVGGAGAFQTGDSSVEATVSLSRVDGKDRVSFKPLAGTMTVLEVHSDGIRWGAQGGAGTNSLLARDATLQLYQTFTTGSPNVFGSTAAKLYVGNRDGAAGMGLKVKFNTGIGAIKQLAHNG